MRKKIVLGCLLISACASAPKHHLPADQQQVAVNPAAFNNGKVEIATVDDPAKKSDIILAVLPIRNNTPDKNLDTTGSTLSDLLSAQLSAYPRVKVVERQRINELVDELTLGDVGPIDPTTAVRYGKMLGANVIVFGSFGQIGNQHVVTLRLVRVETSQVVGGANEYLETFNDLGPHAQILSRKLIDEITHEQ